MKVLLLFNCSSNYYINDLDDCCTRTELFIFMIKTYMKEFPNINLSIKKCYLDVDMKTTFKNPTINNIPKSDHIILVDDIGLYGTYPTFIEYLKLHTGSVSTIVRHSKFYGGEDNQFTYNHLPIHSCSHYIKPAIDDLIYYPRKEHKYIYVLLNKKPNYDMIKQLLYLDKNYKCKIGIINTKSVKFIEIKDTCYEIIDTIKFAIYIDYVYELSKATIFIISEPIHDIYILYELAMCNTLPVIKCGSVQNNIISELDLCTYDDDINWKHILDRDYDRRSYLIKHNYNWHNLLSVIFSQITLNPNQPGKEMSASICPKVGYCLNIKNKTKPVIIDLKKDEELEESPKIIKKKILLQSQVTKFLINST